MVCAYLAMEIGKQRKLGVANPLIFVELHKFMPLWTKRADDGLDEVCAACNLHLRTTRDLVRTGIRRVFGRSCALF